MLCTATRAKKVVVGLTLVALISAAVEHVCTIYQSLTFVIIYFALLYLIVPVTVLIINAIVVREVRRRASSDAATNLGTPTSPVNLVQLRRAYRHAGHHFARLRSAGRSEFNFRPDNVGTLP